MRGLFLPFANPFILRDKIQWHLFAASDDINQVQRNVPALVASYDMHGRAVGLFYTQPTGHLWY